MLKKYRKLLKLLLVFTMMVPAFTLEALANTEPIVTRLEGNTRVETSIEVSREVYPEGEVKNVVLAGFKGEADALTGTLLATEKDAPLLLINKFDKVVKNELKRLGVETVYLLGGSQVINKKVETELIEANYDVKRVFGSTRWETAVAVAKESKAAKGHIFLTNDGRKGGSLADALAVGPVSGRDNLPILLTGKDELPKVTHEAIREMNINQVTIIGGESVISNQIKKMLEAEDIEVSRIAGVDRWDTAKQVADTYFSTSKKVIVTNDGGISFADALMGGYLGAKVNAPILLTNVNHLSGTTKDYLTNDIKMSYILGGSQVIGSEVFKKIQKVFGIIGIVGSNLEVHFIDVGQGDSILIKDGTQSMLIDAGNNGYGETVVNYLKENGIGKLDYVIGTHPHADHIGGLDDVIEAFDIGAVMMPNVTHPTKTFEDVLLAIQNKGLKITRPTVGNSYDLEEAIFTVVAPNSTSYANLNNYSVVVRLEFGKNAFLFTGDAESLSEDEILNAGVAIEADVLKVGHHGSDTSTTPDFLNRVNPDYAVIQVGENNRYNHPDRTVINRLDQKNIKTYRNDLHGTVIAISDGNVITFSIESN